jgi:ATP-dependent exoDNAse (exonuclease V) beta subunit
MAVRDAGNPVYEDLWRGEHGEQEELRREHQRLLYVSMTRARDHLIMLGTLGNGKTPIKQNTWLDCLERTLPLSRQKGAESAPVADYSYPDWRIRTWEGERGDGRRPGQDQTTEKAVDFKIVVENVSSLPPSGAIEWKRVTDFIEQKQKAPLELFSTRTDAGRVSPLTRGSLLHRCLEEYTTKGGYDLDLLLEDYPEAPELEAGAKQAFTDDIESVLQAVLGADDFAWIFKRRENSFSELPFLCTKERSFISGIIDRVVIQDGTGFVIDYKSIRIEDEEALASWINHYRPQIQIYCEAIKQIFSLERVEGYLLFLDSNRLQLTTKV